MFNKLIENMETDLIRSTQEILRIKSVKDSPKQGMPFGEGVSSCLTKVLEIAEGLGFKTCNLDGYIGWAEYGDADEMIAILGHMDVVPEGDGWNYPPYGAEIHNRNIYSRGTLDNKGPMMAALYSVKAIMDSGMPVSKRIRIIFGADEESDWEDIEHYKKMNADTPLLSITPDGAFPIINAEKGIIGFDFVKKIDDTGNSIDAVKLISIEGGSRTNMVPDFSTAVIAVPENKLQDLIKDFKSFKTKNNYDMNLDIDNLTLKIVSKGVGAHGSTPHLGKNAISQLIAFLATLDLSNNAMDQFIKFINNTIGFETNGNLLGIALNDEVSGNLTLNFGVLEFNNNTIKAKMNVRMPVTFKIEDVLNIVKNKAEENNICVEEGHIQPPHHVPKDHFLIKTLQRVYEEFTGKPAELIAIGGGTYAKAFPNSVAFGPIFPGDPDLDHQANEYISIDNLILISKIYAKAIYELVKN
jgi:succinyl-diaminopimelate desuccinylase